MTITTRNGTKIEIPDQYVWEVYDQLRTKTFADNIREGIENILEYRDDVPRNLDLDKKFAKEIITQAGVDFLYGRWDYDSFCDTWNEVESDYVNRALDDIIEKCKNLKLRANTRI